jgi:hypothetical protein
MRKAIIFAAGVILVGAAAATAQRGRGNAPAGPAPTCPASGFMPQAYYAQFGQNGGDGNTAFEIASPCIGKEVREVAESIGMGRSKLFNVKNVIGIIFNADGTMLVDGAMAKLQGANFQMAYDLPALRMMLKGTRANGQALNEIHVFATGFAWNEAQEGRGATAAMNALNDRAPLLKLTPFGAVWSLIDAEGTVKVSKDAQGHTVLEGTSPYDGIDVTVTVDHVLHHATRLGPYYPDDALDEPIAVTAKSNGHTWQAKFDDYYGDPSAASGTPNYLEPSVWMIFPRHLTWTLDGKPYADLHVTYFRSNPYIVFPVPDVVKNLKASN